MWSKPSARPAAMLLLTLLSCDKPREQTPPEAVNENVVPANPSLVSTASAPIAQADLLALLTRWTEAQNNGDFAAYEQLYASKFLGVKRAGEKTTSYAREAWLADRKRMFAKPVKVQAIDPQVRAAAESGTITFTQRWSSGSFADVGPKQLLIVRDGERLRIAHEEMLRSDLQAPVASMIDLHFTLALQSGLYMVLPEISAPRDHGPITPESELGREAGSLYTYSAALEDSSLPPAATTWKGQKVRLDDGCVGELDSFVLLSRVVPHFGTVQSWRGTGDTPGMAADAEQIAQQAFALTTPQVAARVRGCGKGQFAQRLDTPAPTSGVPVEDAALLDKARASFTSLSSVKALQQRHLAEAEDPRGQWWTPSLRVEAYRHPVSGQTLLIAQADNGGMCADFSAQETAVFEARGSKLVRLRAGLPPARILRALDVDGDGRLELLLDNPDFSTDRTLVSPDKTWREPALTHAYQDCPC
jgi:ketosteroid isomerase-like protein